MIMVPSTKRTFSSRNALAESTLSYVSNMMRKTVFQAAFRCLSSAHRRSIIVCGIVTLD